MSEGLEIDCNLTFPDRTWGETNSCGQLPFSILLMLATAGGWGALFVVTGLRRLKHARSATRNMVVSKKMQHLQAWTYSFFHSMVFLSSMFSIGSLVQKGEAVPAIFVGVVSLVGLIFSSQIDVIGSTSRSPGVNPVNLKIVGEYLMTTYLAKVVWKISGHKEYEEEGEKKEASKLSKLLCLGEMDNIITPKVYDIKDVVAMEGAFIGLPALFVYLFTAVRSNGVQAFEEVTIEDFTEIQAVFDAFNFDTLLSLSAALAFVSAILPPILGDWEAYAKSKAYSVGSVAVRSVELLGRLGFYMYFIDYSEFAGFALMGVEAALMFLTNITAREVSAGGRTGTASHYLLSSWMSVFYTNYRRISVDKELLMKDTSLPTTIEFIRFIFRTSATVIGYSIIAADMPESYISSVRDMTTLPALFFVGVASNAAVVAFNVVNFLVVNRSEMNKNDLRRLKSYWASLLRIPSTTVHINRDNNYGEGGITYI